jgi:hypothetical protein
MENSKTRFRMHDTGYTMQNIATGEDRFINRIKNRDIRVRALPLSMRMKEEIASG